MPAFEYHGFNLFRLLRLGGAIGGVIVGFAAGRAWFGTAGTIMAGIIGFAVGRWVGDWPGRLAGRSLFRELERCSVAELREKVANDHWNFSNTLALLHLAAKGESVEGEFPRILEMLESDSQLTRMFGWDALRLVFIKEMEIVSDYDPCGPTEDCRNEITKLKEITPAAPDQSWTQRAIEFLRKQ